MEALTKRQRKIGNNRLLKVAARIAPLRKRYDHSRWVGRDWGGKSDLSCGTRACAMGWATTIPSLRKLGLRMKLPDQIFLRNEYGALNAATKLFYISFSDAENLFGYGHWGDLIPHREPTARQVAQYIRQWVREHQP